MIVLRTNCVVCTSRYVLTRNKNICPQEILYKNVKVLFILSKALETTHMSINGGMDK